jgi:hypothetical protein
MRPSVKSTRFKYEAHIHRVHSNLYAPKAVPLCLCGPFGHVWRNRIPTAIQSRGPWLSEALCCRSGSSLNMASSEAVCPSRRLISFVHRVFALRPRMGWDKQIPQFTPRICDSVPSSVPRRSCRVHSAVTSSTIIAFALSAQARQPQIHARRFSRGCVTRLRSSLYATALNLASPSPARTFTTELSPDGSPRPDVGYDYVANSQLPQPDFHRQDTQHYGLRTETLREQGGIACFPWPGDPTGWGRAKRKFPLRPPAGAEPLRLPARRGRSLCHSVNNGAIFHDHLQSMK